MKKDFFPITIIFCLVTFNMSGMTEIYRQKKKKPDMDFDEKQLAQLLECLPHCSISSNGEIESLSITQPSVDCLAEISKLSSMAPCTATFLETFLKKQHEHPQDDENELSRKFKELLTTPEVFPAIKEITIPNFPAGACIFTAGRRTNITDSRTGEVQCIAEYTGIQQEEKNATYVVIVTQQQKMLLECMSYLLNASVGKFYQTQSTQCINTALIF